MKDFFIGIGVIGGITALAICATAIGYSIKYHPRAEYSATLVVSDKDAVQGGVSNAVDDVRARGLVLSSFEVYRNPGDKRYVINYSGWNPRK